MKINLDSYQSAFSALPDNVNEAEVCADLREELLLNVRDGVQTGGENFSRTTLYLRASGEKTGTILTEKLNEDPYVLMEKALEGAAFSQADHAEPMNGEGSSCVITGDDSATAVQLFEAARDLEEIALALPRVETVEKCSLRKTVSARRVINSKGLDRYQEHTGYLASISVRVKRDNGRGPLGKAEMYVPVIAELDLRRLAMTAQQNADRMDGAGALPSVSVPSGTYAALLSADVTRNIMITAWMAFTGDRIHNGTSAFKPEMECVASSVVNIVDDPTPPGWSVNYGLDSEGSLCSKKYVVRSGKLESPLRTLVNAPDTSGGNAGRIAGLSGTTPINLITVPSCIYVEGGDSSVDEMLAEMNTGIYLTYSLDVFHSINIASGEFSIPCGGIVYKDGKPVGVADQLTIAGNLRDLLQDIRAVGNDLTLEEFMFYHNYSYGGPSLLVDRLAFSSKQE
ncbi:MAG: TldD/PmbA family protein [Oscillospiraceae bacterium]|nr:TldD/PmbA family protein [Oscillospiraceae bacterium]